MTHGAKVKKCIFEGCTKYMPKREEFVSHMAQRGRENDAASRGVPINQKREEFVGRMAQD